MDLEGGLGALHQLGHEAGGVLLLQHGHHVLVKALHISGAD